MEGKMYPILFKLGSIKVYSYGLMVALGFIGGGFLTKFLADRRRLKTHNLFDKLLLVMIAGIIGARLAYWVVYWDQFNHWWEVIYLWRGGFVSYGGYLFGFLTILWLFKEDLIEWLDVLITGTLLGIILGRVGCFLNGCFHGKVLLHSKITLNNRVPIDLFEAGWALIILILMLIFSHRLKKGFVFIYGLGAYALGRIITDYWGNYQPLFWKVNLSQLVALAILIFLVIWIFFRPESKHAKEK